MKNIQFDVLAERYASSAMLAIWSPEEKVRLQRRLWVAALRAQRDLGLEIPSEAIEAYEKVITVVDLASIAAREGVTRHDIKASIEEFNALAGGIEFIHQGFTSRDLTDNIEQLQIYQALQLMRDRTVALLRRFGCRAAEYQTLDICGRSHNIPGQVTTLGKRFANYAEELLIAFDHLEYVIVHYPLRGIKGPMGTAQDMADLLGSADKALTFEDRMCDYLGISVVLESVGQVYPRSLDFEVVSTLVQLASAPANFAKTMRLMAGHELAHEGFGQGQTGSTAMPHKMNSRTCERINGFMNVLGGFLEMVKTLVGDQWYEGDVSCSVVRRVALPGAFYVLDGLYESTMTVLDEMNVFPAMIGRELNQHLPFLSTTRLLTAAIKQGMGREAAHGVIKKHATHAMRAGQPEMFVEWLGTDTDFPLDRNAIDQLLTNPDHGLAPLQVERVCQKVNTILLLYQEAETYNPEPIR